MLITKFEEKFMEHVKATQRPLLDQIGKDGHLSEASDKALNKVNILTAIYLIYFYMINLFNIIDNQLISSRSSSTSWPPGTHKPTTNILDDIENDV